MRAATSGGGWKAVRYTLRMANQAGWLPLWRHLADAADVVRRLCDDRLAFLSRGHGRQEQHSRSHEQRSGE